MNIGDRVKFTGSGQWFREDCDYGTIIGRIYDKEIKRPWLVRWDTGLETRPTASLLVQTDVLRGYFMRPAETQEAEHE